MLADPEAFAVEVPVRPAVPETDSDGIPEAVRRDIRVLRHCYPDSDIAWMFPAAEPPDYDIDYEDFEVSTATWNPVVWYESVGGSKSRDGS